MLLLWWISPKRWWDAEQNITVVIAHALHQDTDSWELDEIILCSDYTFSLSPCAWYITDMLVWMSTLLELNIAIQPVEWKLISDVFYCFLTTIGIICVKLRTYSDTMTLWILFRQRGSVCSVTVMQGNLTFWRFVDLHTLSDFLRNETNVLAFLINYECTGDYRLYHQWNVNMGSWYSFVPENMQTQCF